MKTYVHFLQLSLLILSFTFFSCKKDKPAAVTVTDIEGNVYKTVKIGTQTWMAENLKTTRYNDNTQIQEVTDNLSWSTMSSGAYCWNENSKIANEKFGPLYNFHAVKAVDANNKPKLAPKGWHIPTIEEWAILNDYLASNANYNYDQTLITKKNAKSLAATTDWSTSGMPGAVGNDLPSNNKSGFTALPAGSRSETGSFSNAHVLAYWWSSSVSTNNPSKAQGITLYYIFQHVEFKDLVDKTYGFSVRCIKD
jgi:uncharacterized protein (TIGR02145 family)